MHVHAQAFQNAENCWVSSNQYKMARVLDITSWITRLKTITSIFPHHIYFKGISFLNVYGINCSSFLPTIVSNVPLPSHFLWKCFLRISSGQEVVAWRFLLSLHLECLLSSFQEIQPRDGAAHSGLAFPSIKTTSRRYDHRSLLSAGPLFLSDSRGC